MINTENITLRPPSTTDHDVLLGLRNDLPLQLSLMATPRPSSRSRCDQWIESVLSEQNSVFFVIANRTTLECMGFIQLRHMDLLHGVGRLGICLVPQNRGKGIGVKAIAALEQYAWGVFRIRKVVLEVLATNAAAIRCYEKAGYMQVGVLRAHHYYSGEYHDVLIMERLLGVGE